MDLQADGIAEALALGHGPLVVRLRLHDPGAVRSAVEEVQVEDDADRPAILTAPGEPVVIDLVVPHEVHGREEGPLGAEDVLLQSLDLQVHLPVVRPVGAGHVVEPFQALVRDGRNLQPARDLVWLLQRKAHRLVERDPGQPDLIGRRDGLFLQARQPDAGGQRIRGHHDAGVVACLGCGKVGLGGPDGRLHRGVRFARKQDGGVGSDHAEDDLLLGPGTTEFRRIAAELGLLVAQDGPASQEERNGCRSGWFASW